MEKMVFARVGGLSAHKYKKKKKVTNPDEEESGFVNTFHSPPVKKGVYAFIWPYIEPFLWAWSETNQKEEKINGIRKFTYEGDLWCHFTEFVDVGHEFNGSWVKIHTSELPALLRKVNHADSKELAKDGITLPTNAYKRGRGGYMSRDHLEVFIEKV